MSGAPATVPPPPSGASAPRPVRAGEVLRLAAVLLFFVAAPTAGDIGSCGQPSDDIDATRFFRDKQGTDCARCTGCALATRACQRACDPGLLQTAFPTGCFPDVHDGEVCLDALAAASCGDYASYLADTGATIPTECNFCPAGER